MAVTSDGTPYVEPGDAISAYPVVSQELAAVIDSLRTMIPAGAIFPYAGKTAPEGYLFCDGKAYTRTDFYDLYQVMSEWVGQWGGWPGGNSQHFFVPDFRGRSPIGTANGFGSASANPVRDLELGARYGDYRTQSHQHWVRNSATTQWLITGQRAPNTAGVEAEHYMASSDGSGNPHLIPGLVNSKEWLAFPSAGFDTETGPLWAKGTGENLPPSTGVNFIVWTGTTTAGKNPVPGVELPAVTTRQMIEARLEEAGIGEEEIEQLRDLLATLKEDTDG